MVTLNCKSDKRAIEKLLMAEKDLNDYFIKMDLQDQRRDAERRRKISQKKRLNLQPRNKQ